MNLIGPIFLLHVISTIFASDLPEDPIHNMFVHNQGTHFL